MLRHIDSFSETEYMFGGLGKQVGSTTSYLASRQIKVHHFKSVEVNLEALMQVSRKKEEETILLFLSSFP